jgi:hypothetical protein
MKPDVVLAGRFKTVSGFKGKDGIALRPPIGVPGQHCHERIAEYPGDLYGNRSAWWRQSRPKRSAFREAPDDRLVFPGNFSTLGRVRFVGRFTGFTNDFVAYGDMKTAIGFLSTDINLKVDAARKQTTYRGHLSTRNFDAGKFWSMPEFGVVTLSADVKGRVLPLSG